MSAYYNEFDRQKAQTLRNLIEEGAIAHGYVDERPIQAVQPEDLAGFVQCHFFAGGGVWSYAARLAGWPDDRPLWTGSCPCGPFSKAGLRKGFDDPRHLWPSWLRLIGERRPGVLFGEQSDEADAWLDLVSSDLESRGYAVGSAIVPAAGFGGFHARHRIGFVADTDNAEWWSERAPWHDGKWPKTGRVQGNRHAGNGLSGGGMADADGRVGQWLGSDYGADQVGQAGGSNLRALGLRGGAGSGQLGHADRERELRRLGRQCREAGTPEGEVEGAERQWLRPIDRGTGLALRMGDTSGGRPQGRAWEVGPGGRFFQRLIAGPSGPDWLLCRDGLWRPVEPGTCPLVDETPARMGRLRLYGDAIDAETFANFIGAYLDAAPARRAA